MQKVKGKILYLENYDLKNWGPMKYAYPSDTGFDVRACIKEPSITILPKERCLIPLGFKLALEDGFGYQIRSRSGLSLKQGLSMPNGVGTIDNEYRGEVHMIVINLSNEPIVIERGMRIGQCVIEPVYQLDMEIVKDETELPKANRISGFGSSGIN